MIRSAATVLLLASGWSWTGLGVDRLRWNDRERSRAGIESLEAGHEKEALEAFETAARLDDTNPLLRFNAGSAHLATGSEGALAHLEAAAELAPAELGAPTNYNLGNARLAADDIGGAIEAYEQALRLDPTYEEAKHNLELALLRQQQEQQQEKQDKSSDQGDQKNEQEQEPSKEQDQQGEPPPDDPAEQEQQTGSEEGEPEQEGEGAREDQLPRFEEQPDMTAEQAAAILEAVENLEREQRRKQAAEEIKKRPRKGKDW